MSKKINFEPEHKKAKNLIQAARNIMDKAGAYIVVTAVIADLGIASYFLVNSYDESLKAGDFDPKDDKAIVMEIDGELEAIPLYSYKHRINGDTVVRDLEGNTYVVPKDSNSTLFLGENASEKAENYVNQHISENYTPGSKGL